MLRKIERIRKSLLIHTISLAYLELIDFLLTERLRFK